MHSSKLDYRQKCDRLAERQAGIQGKSIPDSLEDKVARAKVNIQFVMDSAKWNSPEHMAASLKLVLEGLR
ncbi:hypothetical protein [Cylindrospermum sp. FACHB-282]|uniref:hypothetical protein n=1 Tax=Cylindrospermum sp. FACHB-282 TaxID=2692794 RepID=UPI0016849015|nr:hypothetical protein [Cylindrospermum sp. FACHB-282]MBD2387117.1 hypothetical protein [Cylindrospermum sp. FACHB-282]